MGKEEGVVPILENESRPLVTFLRIREGRGGLLGTCLMAFMQP